MKTINLLLEPTERHEIRVGPDDHDSLDWLEANLSEFEGAAAPLRERFIGTAVNLSNDRDVRLMRDHLAVLLHESFPGVEFNIRARMPIRETVVRMKEIR